MWNHSFYVLVLGRGNIFFRTVPIEDELEDPMTVLDKYSSLTLIYLLIFFFKWKSIGCKTE